MSNHPLAELGLFLTGWALTAKQKRQLGELLGVEAAQDVVVDIVAHERRIEALAHRAETYSLEAVRLLEAAQQPDSEGGVNITPNEAKPIKALELKSAEMDHNASELAHV